LTIRLTFTPFQLVSITFTPWFQFGIVMSLCFVKLLSVKIHASICFITVAVFDDSFHEGYNLWDKFGHASEGVWSANPKTCHVVEKSAFPVFGQRT
jgi:hypothetical protein